MIWPWITIVTPSFNQAQFLEETILSVLNQDYPNLEFIVMDGGSDDGSLEIIQKYETRLAYWQSKKDEGQTDAIAQGIGKATGEIVNWINSDDLLAPGALRHIAELVLANVNAGLYAAAVEDFNSGDFAGRRKKWVPENLSLQGLFYNARKPVLRHQPGIFFRREIYEQIGGFRKNYHICMDLDIHIRMLAKGVRVVYSDRTVAYFRCHLTSKTSRRNTLNLLCYVKEYKEICENVQEMTGQAPNVRGAYLDPLYSAFLISIGCGNFHTAKESICLALQIGSVWDGVVVMAAKVVRALKRCFRAASGI